MGAVSSFDPAERVRRQQPPSRHDHVGGSMVFAQGESWATAVCDRGRGGCGQEWVMAYKQNARGERVPDGWRPGPR